MSQLLEKITENILHTLPDVCFFNLTESTTSIPPWCFYIEYRSKVRISGKKHLLFTITGIFQDNQSYSDIKQQRTITRDRKIMSTMLNKR